MTILLDKSNSTDFSVTGVLTGSGGTYPSISDSGNTGLLLYNADRYSAQCDVKNVAGTGIDVSSVAGGWMHRGRLSGVSVKDCYRGFHFHNGGEYETVSDSWADNCVFGFLIESGNINLSNCKARLCSVGLKLTGGSANSHGSIYGFSSTHNNFNLACNGVSYGENIVACNFIAGQGGTDQSEMQFINSQDINLVACQIAYNDVSIDADSRVSLKDCALRGPVNFTVTSGGVLDAKNNRVMAGANITLNGSAWIGNN